MSVLRDELQQDVHTLVGRELLIKFVVRPIGVFKRVVFVPDFVHN